MKKIILINTLSSLILMVFIAGLSTCTYPAYALPAHPHGESSLVTRSHLSAQTAHKAVFCCVPFGYAPVMASLEGDTFACAGFLDGRLTNPLQSCRPHLVMNGKTSNHLRSQP